MPVGNAPSYPLRTRDERHEQPGVASTPKPTRPPQKRGHTSMLLSSLVALFVYRYYNMLSPMIKATLQAALLSTISNILGQIISAYRSNKPFHFNQLELLRFVALTLITAPPNYKWQQLLERTWPGYQPSPSSPALPLTSRDIELSEKKSDNKTEYKEKDKSSSERFIPKRAQSHHGPAKGKGKLNVKNTLIKWFIDCITVGALVNTAMFFILMGVLKGQSVQQISKNVKTETFPLIVTGWRIWPLVSIISFSLVPVERRILFISTIGLFWGIYMSIVAAKV